MGLIPFLKKYLYDQPTADKEDWGCASWELHWMHGRALELNGVVSVAFKITFFFDVQHCFYLR